MPTQSHSTDLATRSTPLPQWTNKIVYNSKTVVCQFFESRPRTEYLQQCFRQGLKTGAKGVVSCRLIHRPHDHMAFCVLRMASGEVDFIGFWRVEQSHIEPMKLALQAILPADKILPFEQQKLHGLEGAVHRILMLARHSTRRGDLNVASNAADIIREVEREHRRGRIDLYHPLVQQKIATSLLEKKQAQRSLETVLRLQQHQQKLKQLQSGGWTLTASDNDNESGSATPEAAQIVH